MMDQTLLLTALLWPLVLLLWVALWPRQGGISTALYLAPLPLLLLVILADAGVRVGAPWLITAIGFELSDRQLPFVLLTALVWLAGGVYHGLSQAEPLARQRRFALFWLVSFWGNTLLVLAGDMVAFYVGFTLMSLSAWGLVQHYRTQSACYAAKIYLIMALIGEVLVLAGLLLSVGQNGSAAFNPPVLLPETFWLISAGFGIKAGVVLLHMWLPLAHPAAPVAASAVLSGVMLKAGILGWLLFLPQAGVSVTDQGHWFVFAGLVGMFFGAAMGLTQKEPKTILAYSSVSQMGWLTLAVGLWLLSTQPQALWAVIGLFALHHGLNKAALFLGAGMYKQRPNWLTLALLSLPVAALAGLPFTSGYLAKEWLKIPAYESGFAPGWVLILAGMATVAVLLHFLFALHASQKPRRDAAAAPGPFLIITVLLLIAPTLALIHIPTGVMGEWFTFSAMTGALLPLLMAAVIYVVLRQWQRSRFLLVGRSPVPAGDVLGIFSRLAYWAVIAFNRLIVLEDRLEQGAAKLSQRIAAKVGRWACRVGHIEESLRYWPHFSLALMLVALLLVGLLLGPG